MKKLYVFGLAFTAIAASQMVLSGCCTAQSGYAEQFDEGFVSLFNGDSFLTWEGDLDAFASEKNPYVGVRRKEPLYSDGYAIVYKPAPDGKPRSIRTKKTYGDFVLRFDYYMPSNGTAEVGLRASAGNGGVTIALADDFGYEKGGLAADRFSGSLVGLKASRRELNERLDYKRETGNTYSKPAERWNMVEVRAIGDSVKVMLNGEFVSEAKLPEGWGKNGSIRLTGGKMAVKWMHLRVKRVSPDWRPDGCAKLNTAPEGFRALFDGKTLRGWKGVTNEDNFHRPWVRHAATAEKRAEMQKKADELMRKFWVVRDGALYFDGKKGGYSLATDRDYGDYELYADWRLLSVQGDSGIYLRGVPQVQIWDAHNMWHLGSGGLYNNKSGERHAMSIADKEIGDWNRFYVKIKGDRVTVRLNGVTVVDDIALENSSAKQFPGPIPAVEQMELQCHGDPIEFRNIYIREL